MVCYAASRALNSGMSTLDDTPHGLHDEALGDDLGPQRSMRMLRSTGAARAGVAHYLHSDAIGLLPRLGALAAECAIVLPLRELDSFTGAERIA